MKNSAQDRGTPSSSETWTLTQSLATPCSTFTLYSDVSYGPSSPSQLREFANATTHCKIALTLNGIWEKVGLEPQGTRARKKACPWTRSCNNYPSIRPSLVTSQLLRSPYPKFNPSSFCLFLSPEAWPFPRLLDAYIIVSFGSNLVTGCKSIFHYAVLANRSWPGWF